MLIHPSCATILKYAHTQGPAVSPHAHHRHQPKHHRPRARLGLPSWAAPGTAFTTAAALPPPYRPASYTPYHIFATTLDLNHEALSSSSDGGGPSPDIALMQGLAAWIPRPAVTPEPYHLYIVAVQRCRALARLRQAIQEHVGEKREKERIEATIVQQGLSLHLPYVLTSTPLHTHTQYTDRSFQGGPARYVLAGSAEIGDALTGRTPSCSSPARPTPSPAPSASSGRASGRWSCGPCGAGAR